ncbi:MAG: hypothetical protein IPJ93_13805 [Bacteroidota bacterium]|nr:MAG: hypothetical protein IPJ93_13805 [Bacteroidota bacterium]
MKLQTRRQTKIKVMEKSKMVRLLQAASNPTLLNRYSQESRFHHFLLTELLIELIEKYPKFEMPTKFEGCN